MKIVRFISDFNLTTNPILKPRNQSLSTCKSCFYHISTLKQTRGQGMAVMLTLTTVTCHLTSVL